MLNLLGVFLGAEGDLIPARADNPTGFWEHSGLVSVNERILEHIGSVQGAAGEVWQDPPPFPDDWAHAEQMQMIAWRAALMLRMHFGSSELWGWKDPRTSLTLPFWQRLVPNMRYVICVRNPADVAASLARRSGFTVERGYELWLRYMNAALAYTGGAPRLFVQYESLLQRTQDEIERLAAFVGRHERARDPVVQASIIESLDASLWNNRAVPAADPEAPPAVRDLHRALLQETRAPVPARASDPHRISTGSAEKRWDERADVGTRVRTHTEDEHHARYVWAAARVSGRVLDIACGTGHGSLLLAETGGVTGVDRDEAAVMTARARVPAGTFRASEVPPIPYPDASFDHAVCFETVEHIDHDVALIQELRRVVAPGGHLLISTPNRAVTSPNQATPGNPYHVREYLLPEFLQLLRDAGFQHTDVYFQRKERRRVPEYVASAVIARVPWLCQPGRWWDRLGHGSGEVQRWTPETTHPFFWVLDCF